MHAVQLKGNNTNMLWTTNLTMGDVMEWALELHCDVLY